MKVKLFDNDDKRFIVKLFIVVTLQAIICLSCEKFTDAWVVYEEQSSINVFCQNHCFIAASIVVMMILFVQLILYFVLKLNALIKLEYKVICATIMGFITLYQLHYVISLAIAVNSWM